MASTAADSGEGGGGIAARGGVRIRQAVSPRPVPPGAEPDHPHLLFNRELSWIDFNWRVLAQATLDSVPLLERVRFLSIVETNLDEFVRSRVGGLKREAESGTGTESPEGRSPHEQLRLVLDAIGEMRDAMAEVWADHLRPELAAVGVEVLDCDDLTDEEAAYLHRLFQSDLAPRLKARRAREGKPFPFVADLALTLAAMIRRPGRPALEYARIRIPGSVPRWIPVDGSGRRFLPVEALVKRHASELFRKATVESAHAFRITRNASIPREQATAEDPLRLVSWEIRQRKFAPVVRLEVERGTPVEVRELLREALGLAEEWVGEADGLLQLGDLAELAALDIPGHRYPEWQPRTPDPMAPSEIQEPEDLFAVLRQRDVLVHHPYDSFDASVQRFLESAAADPGVVAIRQTLYRTGPDSAVLRALARAADAGKDVAVLVEITASFDEEANIQGARRLEGHGVHVTFGPPGLKTHAKATLVLRREGEGEGEALVTYAHIGTGNYNPRTARQYTDVGLLTADPSLGRELVHLFDYLMGSASAEGFKELIVAPRDMRRRFGSLIDREIRNAREGRGGRIVAKMNGLDDVDLIRHLYRASRQGVDIDLIVRGQSRLRPGIPGLSDTIRVFSIVGRFLEHDRIYWFRNGGAPEVFIGSADWRRRNFEERVETLAPVRSPELVERLDSILEAALADNVTAWDLHPDGRYVRRRPGPGEPRRSLQGVLLERSRRR